MRTLRIPLLDLGPAMYTQIYTTTAKQMKATPLSFSPPPPPPSSPPPSTSVSSSLPSVASPRVAVRGNAVAGRRKEVLQKPTGREVRSSPIRGQGIPHRRPISMRQERAGRPGARWADRGRSPLRQGKGSAVGVASSDDLQLVPSEGRNSRTAGACCGGRRGGKDCSLFW
jgi:hypothetical protein